MNQYKISPRYSSIVSNSYIGIGSNTALFLKPLVVCIKILCEDGIELILEYYYVDKYVTQDQPWLLVVKGIKTTVLHKMYIKCLYKMYIKCI